MYDCLKHDVLHYYPFFSPEVKKIYYNVKTLADFVVPQEYGIDKDEKLKIGLQIVHPLLWNVCITLNLILIFLGSHAFRGRFSKCTAIKDIFIFYFRVSFTCFEKRACFIWISCKFFKYIHF